MKKIKIICMLLMVVAVVFCAVACKKDEKPPVKENVSEEIVLPEIDFED